MQTPQFTIAQSGHKFTIEPLPQGYGHTLGNALRRVLYSSIPGAAITSVKFGGVRHQFTTIVGVREDVVQLILNLKQVRLSYVGAEPAQITLEAKGPSEVKAKDFKLPATVTLANPDLVLAHLADKNTKLDITAVVEAGLGYSPAEERQTTTIGVIPVDATFSPVTLVNYSVEATRVGRVTNFDRLILEVTTDGTIAPESALKTASQTLVDFFSAVVTPQSAPSVSSQSVQSTVPGSTVSVEELDLPTRIANALQKAGFETISSLISTPKSELSKVKNLGAKSVKIIELALRDRGFEFSL
ncbi:MAG: DNA-directed RNA polymerase subunit alpha [Candidatus Amesbacteria bacterium GW2011_GWA2_47_11b]|uniref:DNA-directed RNA polymerase subunit alpha n=3 Tax=Candidatus Amesiibacteriota TaxID=1752730 RepID=A0A0G1UVH5_9BACT|nr:MAG: DNA-directed RNA polymerase subunit alpha [Microgenomates group bacterium GW2011_GWC1_46_20]KKU57903.1 MAG: DNA-directed RNA polymerase subunit alpha [Candidatus Amesbacteria bacterium GW2011_GWA2_47_11b]KKU70058.1 MAG: DNA-directed RNA polymerase subunit alpha [Candidatus Amesbacteria bacterium GW2011_GWA1_47_20]KKU83930.1 MAG: DNA-directed RNA polymerase subunit alpha [Candidatus Amesbacteria bacterium GW2011_GWC2_47_8]